MNTTRISLNVFFLNRNYYDLIPKFVQEQTRIVLIHALWIPEVVRLDFIPMMTGESLERITEKTSNELIKVILSNNLTLDEKGV